MLVCFRIFRKIKIVFNNVTCLNLMPTRLIYNNNIIEMMNSNIKRS